MHPARVRATSSRLKHRPKKLQPGVTSEQIYFHTVCMYLLLAFFLPGMRYHLHNDFIAIGGHPWLPRALQRFDTNPHPWELPRLKLLVAAVASSCHLTGCN